jgi:hypothetical protein
MPMPRTLAGRRVLCPSCHQSVEVLAPSATGEDGEFVVDGRVGQPAPAAADFVSATAPRAKLSIKTGHSIDGDSLVCTSCGFALQRDAVWCPNCGLNQETGLYAQNVERRQIKYGRWVGGGLGALLAIGVVWGAIYFMGDRAPEAPPPPTPEEVARRHEETVQELRAELDAKSPMWKVEETVELRLASGRIRRGVLKDLRNTFLRLLPEDATVPEDVSFDQLDKDTRMRVDAPFRARCLEAEALIRNEF